MDTAGSGYHIMDRKRFLQICGMLVPLGMLGRPEWLCAASAKKEKKERKHGFTFAFLTDVHLKPRNEGNCDEGLRKALDDVRNRNVDFILFGGDKTSNAPATFLFLSSFSRDVWEGVFFTLPKMFAILIFSRGKVFTRVLQISSDWLNPLRIRFFQCKGTGTSVAFSRNSGKSGTSLANSSTSFRTRKSPPYFSASIKTFPEPAYANIALLCEKFGGSPKHSEHPSISGRFPEMLKISEQTRHLPVFATNKDSAQLSQIVFKRPSKFIFPHAAHLLGKAISKISLTASEIFISLAERD